MWGSTSTALTSTITFPKEISSDTPSGIMATTLYDQSDTNTYFTAIKRTTKTGTSVVSGRWNNNGNLIYDTQTSKEWWAKATINSAERPVNFVVCIRY